MRTMNSHELAIIDQLLKNDFPGRDEIVSQVNHSLVNTVDKDGSFEFVLSGPRQAAMVKHTVPVEAEYEDTDGITVQVLLFVKNGMT